MEKEKNEEIIGYRIGQGLFCVECYEKGAANLKAVQNTEDPEVKFPSRPITAYDVSVFICEKCLAIKGPDAEKIKIQNQEKLSDLDLQDKVEHCGRKIAFLGDFFSHSIPDDEFFTKNGLAGLSHILRGLEDDLEFVIHHLCKR